MKRQPHAAPDHDQTLSPGRAIPGSGCSLACASSLASAHWRAWIHAASYCSASAFPAPRQHLPDTIVAINCTHLDFALSARPLWRIGSLTWCAAMCTRSLCVTLARARPSAAARTRMGVPAICFGWASWQPCITFAHGHHCFRERRRPQFGTIV